MAAFGGVGGGVMAPKPAAPQVPTVGQNPVGRPPGQRPRAPGQPPAKAVNPTGFGPSVMSGLEKAGAWGPAVAANPPKMQNPTPAPTSVAPPTPAPTPVPAPAPAPAAPAATSPVVATPATVPAVQAQPAPSMNAVNPTQAPAPSIGTPGTVASTPIANSPWAYEQKWGALGDLGDASLDAEVKRRAMAQMENNPYGEQALAQENARAFDLAAAQGRSAGQSAAADASRRGLGGSGVGAELAAEASQSAQNTYAQAARENAIGMRDKKTQYDQATLNQAQSLASDLASRGVDLENLRMQREGLAQQIAAQNRGGGGGNDNMVSIMNPDGTETQVDLRLLDLVLGMEEGGMWG